MSFMTEFKHSRGVWRFWRSCFFIIVIFCRIWYIGLRNQFFSFLYSCQCLFVVLCAIYFYCILNRWIIIVVCTESKHSQGVCEATEEVRAGLQNAGRGFGCPAQEHQMPGAYLLNPFLPTVAFNICCPRDCVSRTANVERNGGHKWVKPIRVGIWVGAGVIIFEIKIDIFLKKKNQKFWFSHNYLIKIIR